MTREIAHQKSFEKALYSISANFPPGKLPGVPQFTDVYMNMSQGEADGLGDVEGSWNSGEDWKVVSDREKQAAVDGGDGSASVKLSKEAEMLNKKAAKRTLSDPEIDPQTGAELGMTIKMAA